MPEQSKRDSRPKRRSGNSAKRQRTTGSGSSFVPCPICGSSFHRMAIESHASDCTGRKAPPATRGADRRNSNTSTNSAVEQLPDLVSQIRYERLNARGATQGRIPVVDSPIRLTPPMPSSKIAAESGREAERKLWDLAAKASPASPEFRTSLLLSSGTDSVTKAGTQAPALPAQSSLHPLLTRARHRRDTLLAVLCHPTLKGQQTVPDFISEAEESQLLAFLDSRRCAP